MPNPAPVPPVTPSPDMRLNVLARHLADHALHTAETLALRPVEDRERRFMLTFAVVADELFRLAARLDDVLPPVPPTYLDAGQRRALALVLAECLSEETAFAHQAAALRAARRLITAQAKDLQRAAEVRGVESEYMPLHDVDGNPLDPHDLGGRFIAGFLMGKRREAERAALAEAQAERDAQGMQREGAGQREGVPWPWSHSCEPMYSPG